MPIFPKPIDLAADYVWTGDHTFDGVVTCSGDFNAVDGDFSGEINCQYLAGVEGTATNAYIRLRDGGSVFGYLVSPSGGNCLRWGGSDVLYFQNIKPNLLTLDIGEDNARWLNYYGVNGSFSGNLNVEVGGSQRVYNLGTEGDTDTEYLETSWDTNEARITVNKSGAGTQRSLTFYNGIVKMLGLDSSYNVVSYRDFNPSTNNQRSLGTSVLRWLGVNAVDADFSGTVVIGGSIDNSDENDLLTITHNGVSQYEFRNSRFLTKGVSADLGAASAPWLTGYITNVDAINGSFSGNLVNEVGGSYKLYNLGDGSAADSEYLNIFSDFNTYKIRPEKTGSGAARELILQTNLGNAYSNVVLDKFGLLRLRYSSTDHILIGAGYTQIGVDIWPTTDNSIECGLATNRWANVASVDGDFSGNITAENLPTSDPGVPGQFYVTTGGALKVSQ